MSVYILELILPHAPTATTKAHLLEEISKRLLTADNAQACNNSACVWRSPETCRHCNTKK